MTASPRDPARYFADHTFAYYVALGASGIATVGLARKAVKSEGIRRLGWGILAVGEAVQLAGLIRTRRKGMRLQRQDRLVAQIDRQSSDGLHTMTP